LDHLLKNDRHPGESRDPGRKPAFKFVFKAWIPAFAGMTSHYDTVSFAGMTALSKEPE